MNYRMVFYLLGQVLLIFAALLFLPLICGLIYGENIINFAITAALSTGLGAIMFFPPVRDHRIYAREGFVLVGLAWILMSLIGALPFVLNGDIPHYVDAVFETASGLTTTGASIMNDVESMSRSGLFWRCFTHWIGGMGVLVFIMAVLPKGGEHSMHIMRAEVPGPVVGKLVPRMRDTSRILYLIYTGLTLLETVFLLLGGMSFYDALLHAFATAGTGGFSTMNNSLAAFDSAYIDGVISVFLTLFAMNFNLFYLILIGRAREAWKSEELHVYFCILLGATVMLVSATLDRYDSVWQSIRYSYLTVISTMSTAGFTSQDYTLWPAYTHIVIVFLMLVGGCAGSTGGGLKVSRFIILCKAAWSDLQHILRPRTVTRVQLDNKRVDAGTVRAVYAFFTLYAAVLGISTFIISFDGYDFTTCFTAALSCISNVGPGLGAVGPAGNFSIFSDFSKIVMTITMLLGRLEIYPLIILIFPGTWKKKRSNTTDIFPEQTELSGAFSD